jgi:hypothetical protein
MVHVIWTGLVHTCSMLCVASHCACFPHFSSTHHHNVVVEREPLLVDFNQRNIVPMLRTTATSGSLKCKQCTVPLGGTHCNSCSADATATIQQWSVAPYANKTANPQCSLNATQSKTAIRNARGTCAPEPTWMTTAKREYSLSCSAVLSTCRASALHATDNAQQTTCNRQRATDNAQQTTCNRQRATDNVQQTTCNRQRDRKLAHAPRARCSTKGATRSTARHSAVLRVPD